MKNDQKKYGLHPSVVQDLCAVFARYPQVEKVLLYGSRAKGNYKNGSDIDLTICDNGEMTLRHVSQILDDIDQFLLPYMFDLSLLKQIDDADVLDHIRRVGVPFYVKSQQHDERPHSEATRKCLKMFGNTLK